MQKGLYIADIEFNLSRMFRKKLDKVFLKLENHPVVLNEDGTIHQDYFKYPLRSATKNRVKDISLFTVKYKVINPRFSSKVLWNI